MTKILIPVLASAVVAGTPILLAALGEILSERVGVLNLGVEGMMLVGAVTGFLVTLKTHNLLAGVVAAMLAAGALAFIHAFLCITFRANQVVTGLALTIFGTGLSGYLGNSLAGAVVPVTFKPFKIPFLGDIPIIGPAFFQQDLLIYLTYLLVPALWFFLYRTRPGLHLRAVGEAPAAADAVGLNVYLTRYIYVIAGGMLAGLGGAYLSMAFTPTWLENMTAGRGWIAVALVIFATWDPVKAMVGAYLFGAFDTLGFRLQALNLKVGISPYFLSMLPYLFTVLILIMVTAFKKGTGVPGSLGLPYDREER